MEKINNINTIIVGGGQSGLSVSYFLKKEGIDHIILEKADKPAEHLVKQLKNRK